MDEPGGQQVGGGPRLLRAVRGDAALLAAGQRQDRYADLEDTSVSEGGNTIVTIRRVIEEIRPTTVYTHTIRDVHPTRFVAIDEYLDRKIEVIQAYASQVAVRGYLDEELLRSTARYWGRFTQARYVEPLEIVRDSDAPTAPPAARTGTDLHAGAGIDVA